MKVEQLVRLVDAGFSKEEIFQLVGGVEPQPVEPEVQPVQDEPVKAEEPAPAPIADDRINNLETKLDYVINRFNYMSVQNSQQPETDKTESIDSILAKIVI